MTNCAPLLAERATAKLANILIAPTALEGIYLCNVFGVQRAVGEGQSVVLCAVEIRPRSSFESIHPNNPNNGFELLYG